jgi:hypothetical protein
MGCVEMCEMKKKQYQSKQSDQSMEKVNSQEESECVIVTNRM